MDIKLDLTGMTFEQQKELLQLQKELLQMEQNQEYNKEIARIKAQNDNQSFEYDVWNDYLKWADEYREALEWYYNRNNSSLSLERFKDKYGCEYGKRELTPMDYYKNKNVKFSGHMPINPDFNNEQSIKMVEAINNLGDNTRDGLYEVSNSIKEQPSSSSGGNKFNSKDYWVSGSSLIKKASYHITN